MCRLSDQSIEGIKAEVPPAYPFTLAIGYLINNDVRTFYFINILLALFSLLLLYKISQNFFKNKYITTFILFLYVTNYFSYWYPTLAMAENLLVPLFLLSILILQQKKLSITTSVFAGVLAAGFYATKYAYAPLTVTFPILYILKVWNENKSLKERSRLILSAAIPGALILGKLVGVVELIGVLNEVSNGSLDKNSSTTVTSGNSYFSINYFTKNIGEYSHALVGKSQRFLWDNTPLTERWIALPGIFGLLINLRKKQFIYAKVWLIIAVIVQLLFMSTFYVVDIRYLYHLLPILLLGFGFFLQHLYATLFKDKILFFSFLSTLLLIYAVTNFTRLKSVIMVNLKYNETPWNYLAQNELNSYFDNLKETDTKPILVTLDAPFFTDNYSNNTYTTLPLNEKQDFNGNMKEVWGSNNYINLLELYKTKITNGDNLYVTNYRINASDSFQKSYKTISEKFQLKQVHSGCYNLCNIYKLELHDK
ncbi:MAG: hypothetical protein BroJett025_04740 [Patescibacteria group bacterium]|nr:MAG: hypothetical protein BroJett025_04740 [Patescibacteria group bacterium]